MIAALLDILLPAVVLTIVANVVLRLFATRRTSGASAGGRGPGRPGRGAAERSGGALVRDPHCGTCVPEARAIRVGSGGAVLYFCSDACRMAWAAAHPH